MKTKINFAIAILLVSLCVFTSCKKDDEVKTDYATAIKGTYQGTLTVNKETIDRSLVIIERQSNSTARLRLKETVSGIGAVDLSCDITVTMENEQYAINGTGAFAGNPVRVKGFVSPSGGAVINFEIAALTLTPIFSGTKQ